MIQTKNVGLQEAINMVKTMSLSKRMRLRYEAHMKDVRDRRAREDYVRQESLIQVAQRMLANGALMEDIIAYTGLTEDVIEKLRCDNGFKKK